MQIESSREGGSVGIDKSFGRGSGPQGREVLLVTNVEIHKPVVTYIDMNQQMREFAFETAEHSYKLMVKKEKRYFKDIAELLKQAFDEKFGGTWHVIVGVQFGAFVSYESQCMIHFWINHIGFMIFKFG